MSSTFVSVLDHGFVADIESWGSDERIIEAARMSTSKGFLGWKHPLGHCPRPPSQPTCDCKPGDEKLLKYLYDNKHATPFEFAGLVIEVKAPIFVFREWHRHRSQSYNEMSARYTPLPDENYIPTVERLMVNATGANKQAGLAAGVSPLNLEAAEKFREHLFKSYADAQGLYEWALSAGVPKELARVHLPVGRYSRMRASANLRNWLGFLTLRMDPAAQWEIRQFANAVGKLIEVRFPRTWELFIGGGK